MSIKRLTLGSVGFPVNLIHIPSPPKQLFTVGQDLDILCQNTCLAVVGSRKVSPYGKAVIQKLVTEVAQRGVIIISGLAIGADAAAHEAALQAGGKTIAVLPSSLDNVYPSSHRSLAKRIIEQGGALVSEYPVRTEAFKANFIARNRLISGLAQAVLIPEAAEKSGSLHTANFALEQGRDVLAVPGNITSPLSAGTNNLIKAGATPVTTPEDVLRALNISTEEPRQMELIAANAEEYAILSLIQEGISEASELLLKSGLSAPQFNQTLTMLEISGRIRPLGAGHWSLL